MSDGTDIPAICCVCGDRIPSNSSYRYWIGNSPIHAECYHRRLSATEAGSVVLSPDELRQVREALTECADDLAAYVEAEYPERFRDAVPSEDRRYKRDIGPVNRARAALAILASKEPSQ